MQVYDPINQQWVDFRQTESYRRRRKIVRDAWIAVAIPLLLLPPPAMLALALLAGFLSLTFLDENTQFLEELATRYPGP